MEEWKERFIQEFNELQTRTEKLGEMLTKMEKGTLQFTPACPYQLLKNQHIIMCNYLAVLQSRAKIENIEL